MKKRLFLFIMIVVFVCSFIGYAVFTIMKTSENDNKNIVDEKPIKRKELAGKKVRDNVYLYTKKNAKDSYSDIYTGDDEIYYLERIDKKYVITKQNIFSKEIEEVVSKDMAGDYCNFEEYGKIIKCYGEDSISFYDEKLEKISEYKNKKELYNYVPYQDKFINVTEIKEINDKKLVYISYIYKKENTFIIYMQSGLSKLVLYDVKNSKLYEEFYKTSFTNENGLMVVNNDGLVSYNIENDDVKRTDYKTDFTFVNDIWSVSKDFKTIIKYNQNMKKLYINDLEKDRVSTIDLSDLKFDSIFRIFINNGYAYLFDQVDDNYNMYVIDVINNKFIKTDKFYKDLDKELNEKIKKLKDDYSINVLVKDDTKVVFDSFSADYIEDDFLLMSYVDEILKVAKRFNKEFFDTFYEQKMKGINIYLTGDLNPKFQDQYSSPAAYTLDYFDKYAIVLDVNQTEVEDNICHELGHTLENNVSHRLDVSEEMYEDWNKYNPSNYYYKNSYVGNLSNKYTINSGEDNNQVYFVSSYANTYPTEDRAQIFSYICTQNKDLLKYEKMVLKAKYMKDEIMKYYPMLSYSSVFDIIK